MTELARDAAVLPLRLHPGGDLAARSPPRPRTARCSPATPGCSRPPAASHPAGSHLHPSLADGHAACGCTVRTTAEAMPAPRSGWTLARAPDPAAGSAELVVRRRRLIR